eukprot:g5171.t1
MSISKEKRGMAKISCLVCLAGIGAAAYWPLCTGAWSFMKSWDDDTNYLENDLFRSLSLQHLWRMMTTTMINVYEPAGWLLKALVFAAFGLSSRAFRAASFVLHVCNAALAATVAERILALVDGADGCTSNTAGRRRARALGCLAGAAVFIAHPVHAEIVGWPSCLPYALACFFALISLDIHVRQFLPASPPSPPTDEGATSCGVGPGAALRRVGGLQGADLASACAFLLAVLSKSAVIAFPAAHAAVDLLLLAAVAGEAHAAPAAPARIAAALRTLLAKLLPHALVTIVMLAATFRANEEGEFADTDTISLDGRQKALKAARLVLFYLGELAWPDGWLRPHYVVDPRALRLDQPACLRAVAALVGLTLATAAPAAALAFQLLARGRGRGAARGARAAMRAVAPFVCWAYFLATFLPTCGIVQHGMISLGGDRYAYVPSLVMVPLLAAFVAAAVEPLLCEEAAARQDEAQHGSHRLEGAAGGERDSVERGGGGGAVLLPPAQWAAAQQLRQRRHGGATGGNGGSGGDDGSNSSSDGNSDGDGNRGSDPPRTHSLPTAGTTIARGLVRRAACTLAALPALGAAAVVLGTLCVLCARQLALWRGDEIMWRHSIEVDPSDWRVLDQYAELLAKEGRLEESRTYYARTLGVSPPPESGVKPMLQMGKSHIMVGDADAACQLYLGSVARYASNPLAQNNAAICHLRKKNIEQARVHFTAGARIEIRNSMYDKFAVKNNLAEFEAWVARGGFSGGGDYHGKLLW